MSATLDLASRLIACRSVTPADDGCQALIAGRLERIGFACTHLPRGPEGGTVSNLWAIRRGTDAAAPLIAFAGHTDVVPTGRLDAWTSDPFVPTERNGRLYGRGAADMKSSIAAMVTATEAFVAAQPGHRGHIAFLITSDEEGSAQHGTVAVCDWLQQQGIRLDGCVVGEPTSVATLGDTVKNGRRGTLSARLVVEGVQGHVAYPQLAKNPIHLAAPLLAELAGTEWDRGNAHFPPTTFQVSNIHAGTGALNVIPGEAVIDFNFRFSTESTPEGLKQRVADAVIRHGLQHRLAWTLGGEPFLTTPGRLSEALAASIRDACGVTCTLSTTGGTSDGRFIQRIADEVMEFGPVNASIHQVDEHIALDSLEPLSAIYRGVLERLVA